MITTAKKFYKFFKIKPVGNYIFKVKTRCKTVKPGVKYVQS